jgi:hypothetical protein
LKINVICQAQSRSLWTQYNTITSPPDIRALCQSIKKKADAHQTRFYRSIYQDCATHLSETWMYRADLVFSAFTASDPVRHLTRRRGERPNETMNIFVRFWGFHRGDYEE